MSAITTHVLDISQGRPARGVPVTLEVQIPDNRWSMIGSGETDNDGRLKSLVPSGATLAEATYRLTFDTLAYFSAQGIEGFYPQVCIIFIIRDATQHYHVPLLLSPHGYSTYRGS
ncbi:MAG: hydroxyisourate hydrolase [Acidobacteria bacterium]|nr:hydroxyisourate hydrolase [Acidobacteriota bacterium]